MMVESANEAVRAASSNQNGVGGPGSQSDGGVGEGGSKSDANGETGPLELLQLQQQQVSDCIPSAPVPDVALTIPFDP